MEMHNSTMLAAFAAGFNFTVTNVSLVDFTVRVTRQDGASWGTQADVINGSYAIEFSAISFFPSQANSVGTLSTYAPGVNPFLRAAFHARAFGELVSNRTGAHTLFLVGGNRARLFVNGTAAISLLRRGGAYEGQWPSGEVTVQLQRGVPVPIEVQFSTAGSLADARASLSWSYTDGNVTYGRTVVPVEALQHRPRSFCLTFGRHQDMAHMEECSVGSPYQSWRFDGGFVRAAGDHYANAETTEQTRCLSSTNTDGSALTGGAYNWNLQTMRGCYPGGYINARTASTGPRVGSCYDTMLSPGQLWHFDEFDGSLLSLSTRNSFSNGTARCPEADICAQRSLSTREYYDMLLCELYNQTSPHMCLQAGKFADNEEATFTSQCSLNSTLQQWELSRVDGNTTTRSFAFDGNYVRFPNAFYDRQSWRLPRVSYATITRRSEYCGVGDANNTCATACDGVCDEVFIPNVPYGWTSNDCAPFTDGWDCDPAFATTACARICSDRPDCVAFATNNIENRVHEGVCCECSMHLPCCISRTHCSFVFKF
jgi:hypothetical protein